MVNNGTSPTIEESLKMIEEKLKIQKKGISEKTNVLKEDRTKSSSLSKLFKENKEEKIEKEKVEEFKRRYESDKKIYLNNLPKVKDIVTMINLLRSLGSNISFNKENLIVDN